jgi:hypothetical protein
MVATSARPFVISASVLVAASLGKATAAKMPRTTITKISSIIVKARENFIKTLSINFKII